MAVDGGPGATTCHMWCANCGTLWEVADMHDSARTNKYFIPGFAFEKDGLARPKDGLVDEPDCPPSHVQLEVMVSEPPARQRESIASPATANKPSPRQ